MCYALGGSNPSLSVANSFLCQKWPEKAVFCTCVPLGSGAIALPIGSVTTLLVSSACALPIAGAMAPAKGSMITLRSVSHGFGGMVDAQP